MRVDGVPETPEAPGNKEIKAWSCKAEKKKIVVSHFIFLLRQASELKLKLKFSLIVFVYSYVLRTFAATRHSDHRVKFQHAQPSAR
jgi:hypothetical protein